MGSFILLTLLENVKNGIFNILNISIVSIQPWLFNLVKITDNDLRIKNGFDMVALTFLFASYLVFSPLNKIMCEQFPRNPDDQKLNF